MKKSRIIIPALAMIAFSVAASITGTVAWFTASRTAKIDAGTYAVVKTTSNLTCKVTSGVGTTATDNDPGVNDVIAVDGLLTDGSFDHVGTKHYIYAPDITGGKVGSRYAYNTATAEQLKRGEDSTHKAIYTAVTWKMEFSLQFGQAGGDIGLYLDLENSSFSPSGNEVSSGQQDTSKGFRMAFMPSDGGNTRVFADLQAAAKCTYVGGEPAVGATLPAGTAYAAPVLIDNSSNAPLAEGYTETASGSMANYFGKFTFAPNTTVKLTYDVVCWFEGTDENIVNGDDSHLTVFRDVTAHLEFSALNFTTGS